MICVGWHFNTVRPLICMGWHFNTVRPLICVGWNLTLFAGWYVWVGILTLFARWYVWVGILTLFARWYVWVGILTLFARWYVWVGILLTRENHLHDYIISLKMDVLAHKTNLTPPYFIQVPLPRQESVRLCICVSVVSISLHSTSLLMDFCNVTTVSYFLFII